jgi:cell division protease FtsH
MTQEESPMSDENGAKKKKKKESELLRKLRNHFDVEPATLAVLEQEFEAYERPNLHLALQELLAEPGRDADLIGIVLEHEYHGVSLARLSREQTVKAFDVGPVEYADVAMAGEEQLACVKRGLYLMRHEDRPLAMLVTTGGYHFSPKINVEVMADERGRAEQFLRRLTRRTRHGLAHRGQVLRLEVDCHGGISVEHQHLPTIRPDEIILPDGLMRRIERHTLRFTQHAERLREAGRHMKRGILLHGPPGTGKTLTAMYLIAQMPDRSVLLLTGMGQGAMRAACQFARMLEPATVVLEDVDLIGTERQHQTVTANALLFELLNQMDGLADDADLLFILTTNRPELLEPALAARPGRIDQAIEIGPPDAECRRRLFELYSRGMRVEVSDWPRLIARTEGASGAFIRELLRKAAVFAAEEQEGELVVRDRHLDEGLAELLVAGGDLTRSLLGVAGSPREGLTAEA